MQYGSAVPPRQQPYLPRTNVENVIYPGHSNPQNAFNQMLQGELHVNSRLPSEQFASYGEPRMSDFRIFQQTTGMANIAAQQQMAFAAASHSQSRPQGVPGSYPQAWPPGSGEATASNGSQSAPNQLPTTANGFPQRFSVNGTGVNGMMAVNGQQFSQLPPRTTLLYRNPAAQPPNSNGTSKKSVV